MKPPTIVLASASPQRRKLLRSMGLRFEVRPSGVPEKARGKDWRRLVKTLARQKASHVAKARPEAMVVGADTIVVCDGRLLLKPRDAKHARQLLGTLNGRWHRVYTGIAVVCRDRKVDKVGVEVSRCKARRLPPSELDRFAGKHLDKAGGYAVQDKADPFIEKVVGPLDNVIGFPRALFKRMARSAGLLALAGTIGHAELRPLPVAEPVADRLERLKPTLTRMGLEIKGEKLLWPGKPEIKEPRKSAYLDEVDYLLELPKGSTRVGTENRLSDTDRHKIGARFFGPELAALKIVEIETGGHFELHGPNGRARHGQVDAYLRAHEAARRDGTRPPPYRGFELEYSSGAWTPNALTAKVGEFVSFALANDTSADAAFRLEGVLERPQVPPSAATAISFSAVKEGRFVFYDPASREKGEGTLIIGPEEAKW